MTTTTALVTTDQQLPAVTAATFAPIVAMVTNAVSSEHTKRAYARALVDFMTWYQSEGRAGLDKATVNAYVTHLRNEGTPASSINQRLVAIRKMANEAADNGLIPQAAAQAIARAEGERTEGGRLGNWLDTKQAQQLLDAPDTKTMKGARDRAILAVLLGCGLRREECAALTVGHLQERDGRWVIVDLVGKRNKTRSIPMPSWAKASVNAWQEMAGITKGVIFRPVNKGGRVVTELDDKGNIKGMTAQAVYNLVSEYSAAINLGSNVKEKGKKRKVTATVHPHDLRRTFAKLAHKGDAPIEQIQLSLGHSSIQTTEKYLGVQQDLAHAPCDVIKLR